MHAITYSTAPQGTAEWLAARMGGIGGSDAAAALGLSKWKTPLALYKEKRGEAEPDGGNWNMERGKAMEPLIRQFYADSVGETVSVPDGILAHPQYGHMLMSVDGLTSERLFEAKTSATNHGWGEEGTDEIPQEYAIQVQHGLIVTGLQAADVAVSIAGQKPLIYRIEADAELQAMIIEGEQAFWGCVSSGAEPSPVTLEEMVEHYRLAREGNIEATHEMLEHYAHLIVARDEIKQLEEIQDKHKAAIMAFLGEHDGDALVRGDRPIITWKARKGAARLDSVALKKAHPEIAAAFTVTGEAGRTFLVK